MTSGAKKMQKLSSWRELLESITNNPSERERIATEIGVRPITLTRWASGESTPRPHNLHHLLNALPKQYRNQFRQEAWAGSCQSIPT